MRRLAPLLRLAASGLLVALVLRGVDLGAVADLLRRAAPGLIALAVACLPLQAAAATLRWRGALRIVGADLPFPKALSIHLVGFFFSQTLPSTVGGDAVRVWRAHRAGLPLAPAARSVVLDRIAGLLTLLLIVLAGQPFFVGRLLDHGGRWTVAAVAAAGLAGFTALVVLGRLPPAAARPRPLAMVVRIARDARALLLSGRPAARAIGLSAVAHLLFLLAIFLIARGLGVRIDLGDCLVLVPPVLLGAALPVSIAGWGVREAGMVAALGLAGVPAEAAVTVSVVYGLCLFVWGVCGGVVWVATRDPRPCAATPPEGVRIE